MRNLKKILALVLALVMTFSLMSVAGAVKFSDSADVDSTFEEAAGVLSELELYKGQKDASGNVTFAPKSTITRAEVAAVVYRIMTGDVKDDQYKIYADYNKFNDVTADKWYAGYVNFCANATLLKGVSEDGKTFNPTGEINGYSVLALMLRAIGYGKNGEYEGEGWDLRTASMAQSLGILQNINIGTLRQPATREMVAEMIFQAINVPTVEYTSALSYNKYTTLAQTTLNPTLGEKQFGLTKVEGTYDVFGRPTYEWHTTKGADRCILVVQEAPLAEYHEATTGATISSEAFGGRRTGLNVWINSVEWGGSRNQAYAFTADIATPVPVGATGRTVEVYSDRMVIVDTMLAKVTKVTEVVNNAAGQMVAMASMTMDVYANGKNAAPVSITVREPVNYPYNVGDVILVNPVITENRVDTRNHLTNPGVLVANTADTVEVVGLADSFTGAMKITWNATDRHTVDDTIYLDANCLYLDDAGTQPGNYRWYLDPWGYVIGITYVDNGRTYGVIDAIQWQNPALAGGYAVANLILMDGSKKENVRISAIGDTTGTYGVPGGEPTQLNYSDALNQNMPSVSKGFVSTTMGNNSIANPTWDDFHATALYQITENADGSYNLYAVANGGNDVTYKTNNVRGGRTTTVASIKSGNPYILGTTWTQSTKGFDPAITGNTSVATDNTTQYLFVNTATPNRAVTAVTGFMGITGEWAAEWVDYVDDDNDARAEYVVVYGQPKVPTTTSVFYYDTDVSAWSNDGRGITVYGLLNGETGSIKLANDVYVYESDTTARVQTAIDKDVGAINPTGSGAVGIDANGNVTVTTNLTTPAGNVIKWMNNVATKDKYHAVLFEVAVQNGTVVAIKRLNNYFFTQDLLNSLDMTTVTYGAPVNPAMTGSYDLTTKDIYSIRFDSQRGNAVYYRGDVVSFDKDNDSVAGHDGDDIWFNVNNTTVFNIDGKVYTQATLNAGTEFYGSVYVVYDGATWIAKTVYVSEPQATWQPTVNDRVYAVTVDGIAVAQASLGGYSSVEQAVANATPYNTNSSGWLLSSHTVKVWYQNEGYLDGTVTVMRAGTAADASYYAAASLDRYPMLTGATIAASEGSATLAGSLGIGSYIIIRTGNPYALSGATPYTYYAVQIIG